MRVPVTVTHLEMRSPDDLRPKGAPRPDVGVSRVPVPTPELNRQPGDDVEIVYFGLLSAHTGNGLGGWALTEATRRAWAMGAKRVWVHTCDLDHPGALAN